MDGLRVKVQHKGMQKLCNNCYGHHLRKECTEVKVNWAGYVSMFREGNPEISNEFYGKWIELIKADPIKRPTEKDFNLPNTKEECEQMLSLMSACGIDKLTGTKMLLERKSKFEQALKDYEQKIDQGN